GPCFLGQDRRRFRGCRIGLVEGSARSRSPSIKRRSRRERGKNGSTPSRATIAKRANARVRTRSARRPSGTSVLKYRKGSAFMALAGRNRFFSGIPERGQALVRRTQQPPKVRAALEMIRPPFWPRGRKVGPRLACVAIERLRKQSRTLTL